MQLEITETLVQKLLQTVDAGLTSGMGKQIPGKMCVEAAVCFAYGLPHSDDPPCVGSAVRYFKIRLNDSSWSSSQARAAGMRKLAVAQLGSNELDQVEFSRKIAFKTITVLSPALFRKLGILEEHAKACEKAVNLAEASTAAHAAVAAAVHAAAAAAHAAAVAHAVARAAAYANAAAARAAYAAARAAYAAATHAAAATTHAAADAAVVAADAHDAVVAAAHATAAAVVATDAHDAVVAADAAADAAIVNKAVDEFLILSADICLEVLKEMKSPGCEWLHLCEQA
jgi:hypothetical protein